MKIAQEKKKKKELLILVIFLKKVQSYRIHTNIKGAMRRCYDNKFDNLDEFQILTIQIFYLKKSQSENIDTRRISKVLIIFPTKAEHSITMNQQFYSNRNAYLGARKDKEYS